MYYVLAVSTVYGSIQKANKNFKHIIAQPFGIKQFNSIMPNTL